MIRIKLYKHNDYSDYLEHYGIIKKFNKDFIGKKIYVKEMDENKVINLSCIGLIVNNEEYLLIKLITEIKQPYAKRRRFYVHDEVYLINEEEIIGFNL